MKLGRSKRFDAAMESREVRRILPTSASAAEIEEWSVAVRERAIFSARTMSEVYLQAVENAVRAILNPTTETRASGEEFTAGLNREEARVDLQGVLEALGYQADPDDEGTLKDLASDQRVDLVIRQNVESAQGFGQWREGQDEEVLDLWPCQELFRAEGRKVERDWLTRWRDAAAAVGDDDALKALSAGRMIARKDSPIWEAISRFGTPYPLYDYNSGMWVRDIDRDEAVALGVIGEWDRVQPQRASFELEGARD